MNSRRCGYEAERKARLLLQSRDWTDVQRRSAGEKGDDLKATDPHGKRWSIEVKCVAVASVSRFWKQARDNAKSAGLPPMLMLHIKGVGARDWLILRDRGEGVRWEAWR